MRILAAMSGGVDSAVVAGLLAEGGHEVIGATLQLYDAGRTAARRGACCAGRDIHDARRVADHLAIPHYVIDAQARFRDTVIDRFADSYAGGETPVPCVRCNQGVKFTDLLGLARELGCEAMATGHYVRRVETPGGVELHRPAAAARDQSWFLFATTTDQLDYLRFPLGAMDGKDDVRQQAQRLGIRVADKPDSQDICFVPDGGYETIVGQHRPEALAQGDIVDEAGRALGRHDGIARYTVGQTKRLGVAAMRDGVRQSVRRIEPATGRIVIGPRGEGGASLVHIAETNWLAPVPPEGRRCVVQLRAREAPRPASIAATGHTTATVTLDAPAHAAPGQACVAHAAPASSAAASSSAATRHDRPSHHRHATLFVLVDARLARRPPRRPRRRGDRRPARRQRQHRRPQAAFAQRPGAVARA
jgi:tRNA-specific 2-thiouridylase